MSNLSFKKKYLHATDKIVFYVSWVLRVHMYFGVYNCVCVVSASMLCTKKFDCVGMRACVIVSVCANLDALI